MKSTPKKRGGIHQRAPKTLQATLQLSAKAMSQAEIAAAAGVSTRTVGQVLNGTYATKPSPDNPEITAKQLKGYIEALTRLSLYLELNPVDVVKKYGIAPELPGVVESIDRVRRSRNSGPIDLGSRIPEASRHVTRNARQLRRFHSLSMVTQGAEMFLNFASILQEELDMAGGHPSMLYLAQKEHARPMMALLARTIIESGLWRVPRSMILEEVERGQKDKMYAAYDVKYSWYTCSKTAKELTTLKFTNGALYESGVQRGIPTLEAYDQCGDIVEHDGHKYVVTYGGKGIDTLFLAPAEWFDLER